MQAAVILVLLLLVWWNAAVARTEEAVDDPYRDLWERMECTPDSLSLCEAILMNRLDIDTREAAVRSIHYEPKEVYRALMQGDADLIIAPVPEPGMLERLWDERRQQTGIEGEMPTLEYIPVARGWSGICYHAVCRQDLPGSHPARQLVEWLQGPEGRQVAQEAGYTGMEAAS